MKKKIKSILITGGTSGLGLSISRLFLEKNYKVIITGTSEISINKATKALEEQIKRNNNCYFIKYKATDRAAVNRLFKNYLKYSKNINVLINNAGNNGEVGIFKKNNITNWEKSIFTNLTSHVAITKKFLPIFETKNNHGVIINISGGGATKPMPGFTSYAAAKTGLSRFTETLAVELKEDNFYCYSLAPGFMKTNIHKLAFSNKKKLNSNVFLDIKKNYEQGGFDTYLAAEACYKLVQNKNKKISGMHLSAIYDDIKKITKKKNSNNVYRLRRIDDMFFKEK